MANSFARSSELVAIYGVFERQFRRYFEMATRTRGQTGVNLLVILERRLDNVVYRMGLAESRPQARQLVSHGHFDVNGRKTNIPSALVKIGDEIRVRESSRQEPVLSSCEGAARTSIRGTRVAEL